MQELETYHDQKSADFVINFIETFLRLPETGKPFILQQWMRDLISHVYGLKNKADGTRVVRTLYIFVPKKNAKSSLMSALSIYHLCADGELAAECICVAGDRAQAGIVYESAKKMVKASPKLYPEHGEKIITPYRYQLLHKKSNSQLSVLSAESSTKEGIKVSACFFDELHTQSDRRLFDTLRGSGLARKQPLTVIATTAGANRQSIAWEIHSYGLRVQSGQIIDPTFHPVIYGAKDDDDVDDIEVWKKVNPSWGICFTEKDFTNIYLEAKAIGPARFASWKRYHLNLWQENITAWLDMTGWNKGGEKVINEKDLEKRICHLGLDVASKTDLTAISLLFKNDDGSYDLICKQFMPRGRVMDAEQQDRQPYREWAKQGYLELTEGNAIDQQLIFRRLIELHAKFPFFNRQIRLDDYNAWGLIPSLEAEGFTPITVSQKARGMNAASKEFASLVSQGKIHHGANPLLTFEAVSTDVIEDAENNIRPVKGKGEKRKRIDGIVASVIAMGSAMLNKAEGNKPLIRNTVYDKRGIFVLN